MSLLWKPLLAATLSMDADFDALPYPLWGSPKIDGVRAMVQRGVVVTRKGLPVRNRGVQVLFGHKEFEGLDGELVIGAPWGDDAFNRTTHKGLGVNNGSDAAADNFRRHGALWVIDVADLVCSEDCGDSFKARHEHLRLEEKTWPSGLHLIPQTRIKNAIQLHAFLSKCLAKGYEGAMLRRGDSGEYPQKPGKENRSTLREFMLVKLKPFEYDTAAVVGWDFLRHNVNEAKTAAGRRRTAKDGVVVDRTQVGSATLWNKKFGEFDVSVPTAELRKKGAQWWDDVLARKGTVRFKYQVAGTKNKPRIPTATFKELL